MKRTRSQLKAHGVDPDSKGLGSHAEEKQKQRTISKPPPQVVKFSQPDLNVSADMGSQAPGLEDPLSEVSQVKKPSVQKKVPRGTAA